jgi:hypothetical protein
MKKNLITFVQLLTISFLLLSCKHPYEVKNENVITPAKADLKSAKVNVFIENSGSMDGYMHPSSSFKNDLYSYISAISNEVGSTNLNYLNSVIISIPQEPESFFNSLNPASFKKAGLDRSHSEIVDMFKKMLNKLDGNTINIFASDCILDVKGGDAKDYFENKRTTLRDTIARHLKQYPDFAVEIFMSESSFDGYLYPFQSSPVRFTGKRPYYVWVFGPKHLIGALNEKVSPYDSFHVGKIQNSASFVNCGQLPFTLSLRGRVGSSILIKGKKKEFDILADMSSALLNDEQIANTNSYTYADSKASVESVSRIKDKQSLYTHVMTVKFSNVSKPIKQSIALPINLEPKWAESLNDDSIGVNTQKTYGIKYLIYAISDAYKNATPAQIQFVINKK